MAEIENLKIGSGGTIHIVGNEDIVAEAWAAGQRYVKDKSYVINNHVLYVCNTSHTSVSPFDPTNWTQITVAESLTSLVDAINDVIATSKLNPVYGNTASGAIATFDTSLALPLQDCTIDINAVQEGTGTPSPDNVRQITGFTGANIHVADNEIPHIIDNVTAISWQSEAGTVYGGLLDVTTGLLTVDRVMVDLGTLNWGYYNNRFDSRLTSMKVVSGWNQVGLVCSSLGIAVIQPNGTANDKCLGVYNEAVYVRYNSITSPAAFKTAMSGVQLVYELAQPQIYQLTPTQISAIVGTNNVFTDTNGDTSVVYACSLKDYIDSQ